MLKWLMTLFGLRVASVPEPTILKPLGETDEGPRQPGEGGADDLPPGDGEPKQGATAPRREEPLCDFLADLVSHRGATDLQSLAEDDRLFVSGVLKRVREERLEVPVLPQAALQISELLANPNSDARAFARVLEADPALSVDVLRIANSAYYGFARRTTSVRDAVVRIGLSQLRGLIIVTHLHGKILQGGTFRTEAEWLVELSMSLAQLAQEVAVELGIGKDEAFTRGVLSHVEHFIIMGSVAEVSRGRKKRIQPSRRALLEAIHLCGDRVRRLAARQWDLEGMMCWEGEEAGVATCFRQLREALVTFWAGHRPVPPVAGIAPQRLAAALPIADCRPASVVSSSGPVDLPTG